MSKKRRVGRYGRRGRASAHEQGARTIVGTTLDQYVLMLYVSDMTPRSMNAIANIKQICEDRLKGRYELEVVDVTDSKRLREDHIVAVPTLVKRAPLPERWMIGDLSNRDKVLEGLDLGLARG